MPFRKFGTSDDQKVLTDEQDQQGVRKESAHLGPQDREALLRECMDEEARWEDEGGR